MWGCYVDELIAGEVARALLYARPPEWADREAVGVEQKASSQRSTALAALCEASPEEVSRQTQFAMIYTPEHHKSMPHTSA